LHFSGVQLPQAARLIEAQKKPADLVKLLDLQGELSADDQTGFPISRRQPV
jgi:hypothetical protein